MKTSLKSFKTLFVDFSFPLLSFWRLNGRASYVCSQSCSGWGSCISILPTSCLIISILGLWSPRCLQTMSKNYLIPSSLFLSKLCKNMTSNFFLSLDYWADTIFRHFYLSFTSTLSRLAVASFPLYKSIFFLASETYLSQFSLFLPRFLLIALFPWDWTSLTSLEFFLPPFAALLAAAPVGFLADGTYSICEFMVDDGSIFSGALELVFIILRGAALFPSIPTWFLSEIFGYYAGIFSKIFGAWSGFSTWEPYPELFLLVKLLNI